MVHVLVKMFMNTDVSEYGPLMETACLHVNIVGTHSLTIACRNSNHSMTNSQGVDLTKSTPDPSIENPRELI